MQAVIIMHHWTVSLESKPSKIGQWMNCILDDSSAHPEIKVGESFSNQAKVNVTKPIILVTNNE